MSNHEPVRVLWLIKGLGPGGAERLLAAAARTHDPERVRLHVAYLLPHKDQLVAELEEAGVVVTCLDAPRERDLGWLRRLRTLVARERIEVVHAHSPFVAGFARLALRTVPRRRRPALVSTEHNAWSTFAVPTRVLNAVTHPLDDARYAVSEEVRGSMSSRLARHVEVLVHGIDLEQVRASRAQRGVMRAQLGFDDQDVVVGTVANYRPQKAYPVLLQAARQVADSTGAARFVVVGQGPLADEVAALHQQLGLGDRLQLLGYRPDAVEVLAACDVFCLSSDYEGLPVAMMEALALGLPVVSTAVGGVAETIRDGVSGRLVPTQDPSALAAALIEVVEDADLRASLARGAAALAERFDMRRVTAYLEGAYADLARRT
jgi:L-malate glycosyltransferase